MVRRPQPRTFGGLINILRGCNKMWSITAIRACGQNTILHLNDCLVCQVEPGNLGLPYWRAMPEYTVIYCGALICLNGAVCKSSGEPDIPFTDLAS